MQAESGTVPCNPNSVDVHQRTALHIAAGRGKARMCEILVRRIGSSIAMTGFDKSGHTPLSIAVKKDFTDVVQHLFRLNADPSARNKYGLLPIQQVAVDGSLNTAIFLKSMKNTGIDYSVLKIIFMQHKLKTIHAESNFCEL